MVNIRLLSFDVDAVMLIKSSAIVTVGMVDLELRPSTGQCCVSCGVTCWTAAWKTTILLFWQHIVETLQ